MRQPLKTLLVICISIIFFYGCIKPPVPTTNNTNPTNPTDTVMLSTWNFNGIQYTEDTVNFPQTIYHTTWNSTGNELISVGDYGFHTPSSTGSDVEIIFYTKPVANKSYVVYNALPYSDSLCEVEYLSVVPTIQSSWVAQDSTQRVNVTVDSLGRITATFSNLYMWNSFGSPNHATLTGTLYEQY
jgi:hypothetical protein